MDLEKNYKQLSLFLIIGMVAISGIGLFFYSQNDAASVVLDAFTYQVYSMIVGVAILGQLILI